jgi:hypothetical protein
VSWSKMSANCILFKEKGFVSGTPAFGTKAPREGGGGKGWTEQKLQEVEQGLIEHQEEASRVQRISF